MKIISRSEYQSLINQINDLESTNTRNFEFIKSLLKVEHEIKKQIDIPYYKHEADVRSYVNGNIIRKTRIIIPAIDFVTETIDSKL